MPLTIPFPTLPGEGGLGGWVTHPGYSHRLITARCRWYDVFSNAVQQRSDAAEIGGSHRLGHAVALAFCTVVCAPVIDGNLGAVA